MSIFIVQHGKCVSKDVDPEKRLSEEGIKEVNRIAEVAKGYRVNVSEIQHSGKLRAHETADIFKEALNPANGIKKVTGMNPLDEVEPFANQLKNDSQVMIVGHLPFLEKLISYLITGSTETTVFKLQNGGIVCLDKGSDDTRWFIKWALMPHVNS